MAVKVPVMAVNVFFKTHSPFLGRALGHKGQEKVIAVVSVLISALCILTNC